LELTKKFLDLGGGYMEEIYNEPLEVDLDDIEGKDPARAKFIKGYLKAQT